MLPALVTDGQSRGAVSGVRGLGRAGIDVLTLSRTRWAAASRSRYASGAYRGPGPADEPGFLERIAELTTRYGPLVVFPGQEESVGLLARHASELGEDAILPYGDPQTVLAAGNKATMAEISARSGLAPPRTLAVGAAGALARTPPEAPCVVKSPELSSALPATRVCETREELVALLTSLPAAEPVLIQEHAHGPLDALSIVLDRNGELAACFASRALRLAPAAAGASSLSVSIAPDAELLDRSLSMLRGMGWVGLAHLQFLRTREGPALIDVNTRYYGSLPLATAAGVNLPAIWYRVATGAASAPPPRYRLGVRYRWLEGEVAAALTGELGRLATRPTRRRAGSMWAIDDPVPSGLLAAQAFREHAGVAKRHAIARLNR